jgi:hypothetical protein
MLAFGRRERERGGNDGFTAPPWKALILADLKGQLKMKMSAIKKAVKS